MEDRVKVKFGFSTKADAESISIVLTIDLLELKAGEMLRLTGLEQDFAGHLVKILDIGAVYQFIWMWDKKKWKSIGFAVNPQKTKELEA